MGARRRRLLSVGLPVVVGTVIGAIIYLGRADGVPAPIRGRIVFGAWSYSAQQGSTAYLGRPRIASVGADGAGGRRLVTGATSPAVSADGRVLAYRDGVGVWVSRADGSGRRMVLGGAPDDVSGPALSPDGRRLVVARNHPDGRPRTRVVAVEADGTGTRTIGSAPAGRRLTDAVWSPDGRSIVLTEIVLRTGRRRLVVVDARGGGRRAVPGLARRFASAGDADVSPDGRSIVFDGEPRRGRSGIYLAPTDGRAPRLLLAAARGTVSSPAFSPDGRSIVLVRFRDGTHGVRARMRSGYRIVTVDLASGAIRTVRSVPSGLAEDVVWR